MTMKLKPILLPALFALWSFAAVDSAFARSGSGSDGDIDDKIEDEIEDDIEKEIEKEIEDRLKDRIDGKIEKRAEERTREKSEEKAREKARKKAEDEAKDRAKDKARDRAKERSEVRVRTRSETRSEDGKERVREETRSREKSESRSRRSHDADRTSSGSSLDKISADLAKDKAKAEFVIAVAAADAGRDIARAEARAARDAALAEPGADEEAIKEAYKSAVKAADDQRDFSREEAKETYEAELEELDDDHSGHGGDDDDVAAAAAERAFFASTDPNGDEIARGEWLLLTAQEDVDAIVKRGFAVKSVEVMKGLDLIMARLEAPQSFSLPQTAAAVQADTPAARVDYNHLYFPETNGVTIAEGDEPAELMPIGDAAKGEGVKIGVIDTSIDRAHTAFRAARVYERNFVPYGNAKPSDHGTAVASIIAGEDASYRGLAPRAQIVAASVFFNNDSGRASATTESLVRALDWMSETGTPIVSMSLAGPPNSILEAAIERAAARGVLVVAAAGNEGPAARPMYPAAYEKAVAVTAVSKDKKVYRLANRGDYVDLAAPGVSVRHARSGGGYAASSGTSMAAPFVAAALAELRRDQSRSADEAVQLLIENAEDLGDPGRDPVYGAGLVRPIAE